MPDAAAVPEPHVRAGLVAAGRPVPLQGVSIEARVREFCSQVVVSQRYRNLEVQPIEAVYVFPLDEGAAVCGFEAVVDGVHVVGEVQERERAFETYDDALAAGHGAYLLDQERPDVFTASIGNVPPGREVLVRITYASELQAEGDGLRFVLPTTVSPRYAPAEDRAGVGRSPAEAVNPAVALRVPYRLSLAVELEMAAPIRSVESPSHPISVETDGARASVRLGGREAALDRDFVLEVRVAGAAEPRALVEVDEAGGRVAAVAFQPRFETEDAASELVFVVDRSGSMDGTSIDEASNALQLCLRSLREGTWFNVVGFGDHFQALFPESRPYGDASLDEASRHVATLTADMGGTEILPALQSILERSPAPGRPRQLFVLTDGQVSNTAAVLELVRKHSGTTRVFTFGIGAGASHHLVRGMARAGEGACELIHPGERIEGKVLRQLRRALAPGLTDVMVDWGRLHARQAPHYVPPVFAGGRVLVYGFLEGSQAGDVTLRAHGSKGPLAFTVRVDPGRAAPGRLLATLAARATIRDLEEGTSPLHDRRGSLQDRGRPDRVKQEIVRLGVAYGLCSRETSFVAVEKRETPVSGPAQLRRIPVALTRGWGGVDEAAPATGAFPAVASAAYRAAAPAMPLMDLAMEDMDLHGEDAVLAPAMFAPKARREPPAGGPAGAPARPARPLDRLASLQGANGSWELGRELCDVLGLSLSTVEAGLRGAAGDAVEARRALATALALVWLETRATDSRDEWTMLAEKAERWLLQAAARPERGRGWRELAGEALEA